MDCEFPVEQIQKLDLLVPVKRVVTAGRRVVCQLDAELVYLLKCFILCCSMTDNLLVRSKESIGYNKGEVNIAMEELNTNSQES